MFVSNHNKNRNILSQRLISLCTIKLYHTYVFLLVYMEHVLTNTNTCIHKHKRGWQMKNRCPTLSCFIFLWACSFYFVAFQMLAKLIRLSSL